jgi:hypothetical protein
MTQCMRPSIRQVMMRNAQHVGLKKKRGGGVYTSVG